MNLTRSTYLILIAAIFHIIGIIGFLLEADIISLTPLNLVLVYLLIILNDSKNASLIFKSILIVIAGITIELIGIHTGLLFGNYEYGEVLGPTIYEVPLTIGINWFVITYCGYQLSTVFTGNIWIRSILAGLICTGFDFILEPVAVKYNFWTWDNGTIPINNYITWFIFAAFFSLLYGNLKTDKKFPISVLFIWIVFFSILNLL